MLGYLQYLVDTLTLALSLVREGEGTMQHSCLLRRRLPISTICHTVPLLEPTSGYYNCRRENQQEDALDAADLARKIVDIASDKKAVDVVLLDIRKVTVIADYFVICSGTTDRQIDAIVDAILESLKKDDRLIALHVEGTADSGWVLLDYGGVIVHVFSPSEREYYKLDKIWNDAVVVLRML
jgi:ribosome-associated protein